MSLGPEQSTQVDKSAMHPMVGCCSARVIEPVETYRTRENGVVAVDLLTRLVRCRKHSVPVGSDGADHTLPR